MTHPGPAPYARGFVLSDGPVATPVPDRTPETLLGLTLTKAPEVTVTRADSGGSSVIVLGHLIDTGRWLAQGAAVAAAAHALARSESAFLDLTDAWSGRYLVVYGDASSRRVMTDAAGMRSAFYALEGRFVLGTHARLVADIVGAPPSPIVDAYHQAKLAQPHGSVPSMPGRSTPWTGVVALTANQALDVETRQLHRIFPRGPLPRMDARSAASAIGPRLRRQVESLVASGRPVALSVTAGRDTRLSLAASRPYRDAISYFTYLRPSITRNHWDVSTARSLAAKLPLSHRVLDIPADDEPPELWAAMEQATLLTNGRQYVAAYRAAFPSDTIHIRSNIGEIGRSYYRRHRPGKDMDRSGRVLTAGDLAALWGHGVAVSPLVIEAFDDWMGAVGFADVQGMDALDVFYWEHRMACWHADIVLASDFAFDTHVLFNARTILRDMLAVPAEDRARSSVFKHIVADLWPELGRWPYRERGDQQAEEAAEAARVGRLRRRIGGLLGR